MTFRDPFFLLLIIPLALLFIFWGRRQRVQPAVLYPTDMLLKGLCVSWRARFYQQSIYIRFAACGLIILALARPQGPLEEGKIHREGIDIVLALDVSTSMLGEDFRLNGKRRSRIDVVKDVVADFIKSRPDDRIGLVVFAARAYTAGPLTLDHDWLLENLGRVKSGMAEDGTAIGSGLAVALKRVEDSKAKSRIIILLTDGRNNAGSVAPLTAAEAAKTLHVKMYTIGAGSTGPVPYPFQDIFGNIIYRNVEIDLDEDLLAKIAKTTEGYYFRATDTGSLKKIYEEINKMEKVSFEEKGFRRRKELFFVFVVCAIILLMFEIVIKHLIARKVP